MYKYINEYYIIHQSEKSNPMVYIFGIGLKPDSGSQPSQLENVTGFLAEKENRALPTRNC